MQKADPSPKTCVILPYTMLTLVGCAKVVLLRSMVPNVSWKLMTWAAPYPRPYRQGRPARAAAAAFLLSGCRLPLAEYLRFGWLLFHPLALRRAILALPCLYHFFANGSPTSLTRMSYAAWPGYLAWSRFLQGNQLDDLGMNLTNARFRPRFEHVYLVDRIVYG